MVKNTPKKQGKRKNPEPPEEGGENSREKEPVPRKVTRKPAKVSGTPGKKAPMPGAMPATPGKKRTASAKSLISPRRKAVEAQKADNKEMEDDDEPKEAVADINLPPANGNDDLRKSDDDVGDNAMVENVNVSSKRKKAVLEKSELGAKKQKNKETETFTLHIRNLNSANSFDELKEAIRQFFSEQKFTVCDVRIAGSKKFGYVDFPSEGDLQKALTLNGAKILDLETTMDRAQSYESSIKAKKERTERILFAKNLPYSTTSDELQKVFVNAINIRTLASKKKGTSKGAACIEFKSAVEMENALKENQGTDVGGRSIVLQYASEKGRQMQSDLVTVVVKNLAYKATESSLQNVFKNNVSIRIPKDDSGRSKGFALVEYPNKKSARKAMESHKNVKIEGRHVCLELQGAPLEKSKTLFVSGLSADTTEERLKEAFVGALGAIIVTDRVTGASRGFGFVDFPTAEDASAAKEAMEDGEIDGNKILVDFAQSKRENARGGGGSGKILEGKGDNVGRGRGTFRGGRGTEKGTIKGEPRGRGRGRGSGSGGAKSEFGRKKIKLTE
ncbi:nucleolin-like [Pleurodeles waltl]|uniref:nucleolin-like n=1 Tax=Pleurodeles waltl TaxID=8319 RepID=UPI0037098ECD